MANLGSLWFEMDVRNNVLKELKKNQEQAKALQKALGETSGVHDKIIARMGQLVELEKKLTAEKTRGQRVGVSKEYIDHLDKSIQKVKDLKQQLMGLASNPGDASKSVVRSLLGADTANQIRSINYELGNTRKAINEAEKASQATSFFSIRNWRHLASAIYSVRQIASTIGDIFNTVFGPTVGFEKQLSNLAAILQTNTDGIAGLEAQALSLGRTTNYTASQVVQLQTELSKLGYTEQEVKAATPGVLEFAQACGTDLASAATTAGSAIRAFGADASETKDYVATMAIATTHSALQFSDFQTIIGTVFPVAHQFNLTIEDTVALMMKLKDAGMDTSTAATSLRNIFLNLSDGSSKLSKLVGGNVHDMESFVAAMQKMSDAAKVYGTEFLGVSGKAAGKRGVTAFNVIAEQANDLKRVRESITDVNDELDEMANTQTRNAASAILRVKSAWEGWMLSIRESDGVIMNFLDGLATSMNRIADFFTSSTKIESAFDQETANAVIKTRDYINTLNDAEASSERKEKAAKKLADQLVENGIVTQDLIDKMKDQYGYYDFLIEKEEELTATLKIQAAERVAIREQENAQTAFNNEINTAAREGAAQVALYYGGDTGIEMTKSQQIQVENFMIMSFQRMAKAREDYAKSVQYDEEKLNEWTAQNNKKMWNDIVSYTEKMTDKRLEAMRGKRGAEMESGIWAADVAAHNLMEATRTTNQNLEAQKEAWGASAAGIDTYRTQIELLMNDLEYWQKQVEEFKNRKAKGENVDASLGVAEKELENLKSKLESAKELLGQEQNKLKVNVTTDEDTLIESLLKAKDEIDKWREHIDKSATEVDIDVKLENLDKAMADLEKAKAEADKANKTVDITVVAKVIDALKDIGSVEKKISLLDSTTATINVNANTSLWDKAVARIRGFLNGLGITIGDDGKIKEEKLTSTDRTTTDTQTTKTKPRLPDFGKKGGKGKNTADKVYTAWEREYKNVQEYNKRVEDAQITHEKAMLDIREDGEEKTLALLEHTHKANLQKIAQDREAEKKRLLDLMISQEIGDKPNAKKSTTKAFIKYTMADGKISDDILTDSESLRILNQRVEDENNRHEHELDKVRRSSVQSMWDYLQQYGNFYEQRLAITQEYERKIAEAKNEWERKRLEAEKQKKLENMEIDKTKRNVDWMTVSTSAQTMFQDELKATLKSLKKLAESEGFKAKPYDEREPVYKLIKEISDAIVKSFKDTFLSLKDARSNLETKKANYEDIKARFGNSAAHGNVAAQNKIAEAEEEYMRALRDFNNAVVNSKNCLDQFASALQGLKSNSLDGVMGGLDKLGKMLSKDGGFDLNEKIAKTLAGVFPGITGEIVGAIWGILDLLKDGIGPIVANVIDTVNGAIFGILDNILSGKMFEQIGQSILDNVTHLFDTLSYGAFSHYFSGSNEGKMNKLIENLTNEMKALGLKFDALTKQMDDAPTDKVHELYEQAAATKKAEIADAREKVLAESRKYSNKNFGLNGEHSTMYQINHHVSDDVWKRISAVTRSDVSDFESFMNLDPEQIQNLILYDIESYLEIFNRLDDGYKDATSLFEEYMQYVGELDDLLKEAMEKLTGTTAENIANVFANALDSMIYSTKDVSNEITKILRTAVTKGFISKNIQPMVEEWYEQLYAAGDGGTYTQQEIADLKARAAEISNKAEEGNALLKKLGLYEDQYADSAKGVISGITEDQADLGLSYLNAMRADLSVNRMNLQAIADMMPPNFNELAQNLSHLKSIEDNTRRNADTADDIRDILNSVIQSTSSGRAIRIS